MYSIHKASIVTFVVMCLCVALAVGSCVGDSHADDDWNLQVTALMPQFIGDSEFTDFRATTLGLEVAIGKNDKYLVAGYTATDPMLVGQRLGTLHLPYFGGKLEFDLFNLATLMLGAGYTFPTLDDNGNLKEAVSYEFAMTNLGNIREFRGFNRETIEVDLDPAPYVMIGAKMDLFWGLDFGIQAQWSQIAFEYYIDKIEGAYWDKGGTKDVTWIAATITKEFNLPW